MKNFLYGAIAVAILGLGCMFGYYLYNKAQIENIQFIQEQQKLCEEKYSSELQGTGYNWIDGADDYSKKDVKIKYSEKEKACIEEYSFERGYEENGVRTHYHQIEIKNLDNGIIYFDCNQDDDGAECMFGCSKRKMKTCVGDIDENDPNAYTKMANSDYVKISYNLGLISDVEIEQLKSFDKLINETE